MRFLAACKTYVAMPFSILGKLVSSAGQTLFGTQKAVNYILKDSDNLHPVNISVSSISIFCNFFVNCVTRVPALYYKFTSTSESPAPTVALKTCCSKVSGCLCGDFSPCPSGSAYFVLRASGAVSAIFTSINAYLGAITLSEFIASLSGSDIHDGGWIDTTVQASAVLLAVTSFASYYTYNLRKVEESSRKFSQYLEDRKDPHTAEENTLNKKHALAWLIASFSIISAPFLAYFSTKHALIKIPKGTLIPDTALKALAGGSSVSSLLTTSVINVPSIYTFLAEENISYPETTRFKILRYLTYGIGSVDSLLTGLGNYRGVIETFKDISALDPYGPIITLAIICGLSTTASNFTFSVYDGYNKFMLDLYKHRNYTDIPDGLVETRIENLDAIAINDSDAPRLYGMQGPQLFTPPPSPTSPARTIASSASSASRLIVPSSTH